jgi:hypothetical protein
MNIVHSTADGWACFSDYFDEDEIPKMVEFAKSLKHTVTVEETDRRFRDVLNPLRKPNIRDIDWQNYMNIVYVIKNRDKSDEAICEGLGSAGSGFSITVRRGKIMTQYSKFLEVEGGNVTEEKLVEFAKLVANKFSVTDNAILKSIEKMKRKGCTILALDGFPECRTNFHADCITCPFNKDAGSPIKNEIDINRFNSVIQ